MNMGEIIKKLRLQKGLTQEELGKVIGVQKSAIRKYESGAVENLKRSSIEKLAEFFGVTPSYLMGWQDEDQSAAIYSFENIHPITTKRIPMLGNIACGVPTYAAENRESYIKVGTDINADFCLTARGDSMIGARIHDGDIVFCRAQESVENGEIAVVLIGDEATLKRVYFYPEKEKLVLQAENPQYEPFVYVGSELQEVRILGKAIAFQSDIR